MYLGKDRKQNRWLGYDYNTPGWYFVTICTKDRVECLCNIENGVVGLNKIGEIVRDQLLWLAKQFDYVVLDDFVIMPNHIHAIIELKNENYYKLKGNGVTVGTGRDGKIFDYQHNVGNVLERSLHDKNVPKILPVYRYICAFKTVSSKLIHKNGYEYLQWQKSFHDHVIRGEKDYNAIKYYIEQNPAKWAEDKNNPINFK